MFCPKCSAYLSEREIVKMNVKYAPGNVPIMYEAQCPHCRVEMGTVSWGQLTVNPELAAALEKAAAEASPPPEEQAEQTSGTAVETPAAAAKTCPHCGKPLPENF